MFNPAAETCYQPDLFASRLMAALAAPIEPVTPVAATVVAVEAAPVRFVIPTSLQLGTGGPKAKFAANVAAITTLRTVEGEYRDATQAEREVMVRYVGWGGLSQAFRNTDTGAVIRGWEAEAAQLEALLTADELAAARRSTQDSHYTPRAVVEAIHAGLARIGFNGGVVLDPAFGTGHFLGLAPQASRDASKWTAVELDSLTSSIAATLYPEARLMGETGFQDVRVAQGHYDAAIGNPPFGATVPYDANHPDLAGWTLHNFFFGKSVKALRAGGVLAMVVTHRLMDRAHSKERQWLAERTELLGAIRLPRTAFLANAGTDVTTDIVFLRKLGADEAAPANWYTLGYVASDTDGDSIPVNSYFASNPHMMLGQMVSVTGRYGGNETALLPRDGQNLADALHAAIHHLPVAKYTPRPAGLDAPERADVPEHIQPFGHFVAADGAICQRVRDVEDAPQAVRLDLVGRPRERILAHMQLRDLLRKLLASEQDMEATDGSLHPLRGRLNAAYDAFVRKWGYLNSQSNTSCFRDDVDSFRLRALEKNYQRLSAGEAALKGMVVKSGRTTVELCEKADILLRRVLRPLAAPIATTPADALAISLNTSGTVDVEMMADMLSMAEDDLIDALGGMIFRDPARGWKVADDYLSGNVKAKLAQATTAAQTDPTYQRNVDALMAVQPADLSPADIYVNLGSPWVPADVYSLFANEVLGFSTSITLVTAVQKFVSNSTGNGHSRYGTDRVTAADVFEKALGREPITLYWTDSEGRSHVDNPATVAARDAVDAMRNDFDEWVWADLARRERLAAIYNATHNTDVPRRYDGSFLTFPGKVDDSVIALRTSQVNGVYRIIQDGGALIDHTLGAGKTYLAVAAAMELKRLGLVRKPMFVVPNHLVTDWATAFLTLYPTSNVLAVTDADFTPARRKLLFARIATGEWDAVIVAHSQFGRIKPPVAFEREYIADQISEHRDAVAALRAAGASGRTVKQAEARIDQLKETLKQRMKDLPRDDNTALFDEMGVDLLAVDEAHEFKNLAYTTRKRNVSGLGNPTGSQKAEDMYIKCRYLQKKQDGRGVVFLTGTPISNSLVELWTMSRYLAYDALAERGLHMFDLWANSFASETTSFEIDSSGQSLKAKTVLAKFLNVPEMMALYTRFADTVSLDDLKALHMEKTGKPWPVPKVTGGKPENVVCLPSAALSDYIDNNIIPRMQAVSGEAGERPDPRIDNMLRITNDARLAALDVRLMVPNAADDYDSKVNTAARRIVEIYNRWNGQRGTQLVFCDLSTPAAAVSHERMELESLQVAAAGGDQRAQDALDRMSPDVILSLTASFSVYDDLRAKLIASGIHPTHIAFMQDAKTDLQKKAIFARMNRGDLRVLIGSTRLMGAGSNVQRRLVALTHLDCPWRASDLEQREGRIIRQGNMFYEADPENFEVAIMRYATQRTYDSRMWQLVERKAAIVDQVRKADGSMRDVDDVAGQAACAAEMKAAATGNPDIIAHVELSATVKRLSALKRNHASRLYDAERRLGWFNDNGGPDARLARELAKAEQAEAHLATNPVDPFGITIHGSHFDTFKDGANALCHAIINSLNAYDGSKAGTEVLGDYRGATLKLHRNHQLLEVSYPDIGTIGQVCCEPDKQGRISAGGTANRLATLVRSVADWRGTAESTHANALRAMADLADLIAAPFRQAQELTDATSELRVVSDRLVAASLAKTNQRAPARPVAEEVSEDAYAMAA